MRGVVGLLILFTCASLFGCEEEITTSSGERPKRRNVAAAGAAGAAGAGTEAEGGLPAVSFEDSDFAESERSRDPFRSYAELFAELAKNKARSQREVVLERYSLDELKLVGIVTRIHPGKAMLVDPSGKGHVIQRGQFVGKPEIVQGGTSGADYEINWRVDRIRDQDVVLVREDPTNPDVPSSTRVIALRPERPGIEP